MSDADLREIARRAQETGSVEDRVAWLRSSLRHGAVSQSALEAAALFGDRAALKLTAWPSGEAVCGRIASPSMRRSANHPGAGLVIGCALRPGHTLHHSAYLAHTGGGGVHWPQNLWPITGWLREQPPELSLLALRTAEDALRGEWDTRPEGWERCYEAIRDGVDRWVAPWWHYGYVSRRPLEAAFEVFANPWEASDPINARRFAVVDVALRNAFVPRILVG